MILVNGEYLAGCVYDGNFQLQRAVDEPIVPAESADCKGGNGAPHASLIDEVVDPRGSVKRAVFRHSFSQVRFPRLIGEVDSSVLIKIRALSDHEKSSFELSDHFDGAKKVASEKDVSIDVAQMRVGARFLCLSEGIVKKRCAVLIAPDIREVLNSKPVGQFAGSGIVAEQHDSRAGAESGPRADCVFLNVREVITKWFRNGEESQHLILHRRLLVFSIPLRQSARILSGIRLISHGFQRAGLFRGGFHFPAPTDRH